MLFDKRRKKPLFGKVVVITGGARGIGLETARHLKRLGAYVALGDIDGELAANRAATMSSLGGVLDVRSRESFDVFLQKVIKEYGQIDVLINNAGIMPMGYFLDEDPSLVDAQIDINLRGVIHGMQAVLPGMLARRAGHVINIASVAGLIAVPGAAVYTGTKFAVVGMTEAIASEYRGMGVNFSVVLPSKVDTELSAGLGKAAKGVPSVKPEDVAKTIEQIIIKPQLFAAVPDYLRTGHALYTLAPTWLQQRLRQLVGDKRILDQIDRRAHASYEQRINGLARGVVQRFTKSKAS